MYQIKLGLRSLFYRKTQYISLFLVCALGVAVSLASIFVSNGMIKAMIDKAEIYFGGDFVFAVIAKNGIQYFQWEDYIDNLEEAFGKDAVISPRMDFDARHSAYYFEGVEALQKTIKGIDFEKEAPLFRKLNFVEGGFEDVKGTNGVLISSAIAKILGVHAGDSMTFMLQTYDDEKNTIDVVVKGIFQDSSVFGMYTSYMDFDFLKAAYARPNYLTNANRIVINFPKKNFSYKEMQHFQEQLEKKYDMTSLVDDKDDFFEQRPFNALYAIIPLDANLSDVKIMEKAMNAVVSFVIIMLVLIIIAGIGSTYRVLIMKRINEIGIYMAIGMKKKAIASSLLFESLLLLALGSLAGILLSFIICGILSLFNFSFIPAFDMFLVKGNLSPEVDVIKSVEVIAAVVFITLLAVLYSTKKSIKILPVQALATTE